MSSVILLVIFPAFMAFAAVSDLLTMTISNRLNIGLAVLFLIVAPIMGLDMTTIGWHLLAGFAVLALCFFLFAMGWMGGGDAKLAAATALWLGFEPLYDYLLATALLGGVLTLALIRWRDYPLPAFAARWPWTARLHEATTGIPYGIALAAAGLFAIVDSPIWRAGLGA